MITNVLVGLSAVGHDVAAAWRGVLYGYSTLHHKRSYTHHERREVGVVGYHCVLIHTESSYFDAARKSNCNIFFLATSTLRILGSQTSDYFETSLKFGDIKAFSLAEHGSYYTHCAEASRYSSFCTASWPTRESEACYGLLV